MERRGAPATTHLPANVRSGPVWGVATRRCTGTYTTLNAAVFTRSSWFRTQRGAVRKPPLQPVRPRAAMFVGEGFARWSERTERCRLFSTKEQRNASPWQKEAGAQRRVRADAVVVRPLRVHVVCHPAPCLAAAIPSRDPMQHGML
jgi:hypothetical protein